MCIGTIRNHVRNQGPLRNLRSLKDRSPKLVSKYNRLRWPDHALFHLRTACHWWELILLLIATVCYHCNTVDALCISRYHAHCLSQLLVRQLN